MDFVKVQGLGNDFIVVDGPFVPTAEAVRQWCDRRTGIGADGVLVIEPVDEFAACLGCDGKTHRVAVLALPGGPGGNWLAQGYLG